VLDLALVDGPQRVTVVNAYNAPHRGRGSGLDGMGSEAGGLGLLIEAGRLVEAGRLGLAVGLLAAASQPASTISMTSGRAVRMAAGWRLLPELAGQ
jgi:hypothetical protein